jgi:OmpA-OmpF porin, OOP family
MKKLLIASAVAGALVAGHASAQMSSSNMSAPQMYVGAGVGSVKNDNREDSWKLYAGYQFDRTWGMEVAYNDLGQYRGADIESWSLAGTGTIPLNESWALMAKLGATSNRSDFAGGGNHTTLLAGVGVSYSFTKNIGVRLEYEDFGKLADTGNDSRGKNVALSVKYGF